MRTNISMSAEATPNKFLDPDGLLNVTAIMKLAQGLEPKIQKEEAATGFIYYVVSAKLKKGIRYSASLEKKNDLKYKSGRAFKIVARTRRSSPLSSKNAILLTVPSKEVLSTFTDSQKQQLKLAVSAIKSHIRKSVSVSNKISKVKASIRNDNGKIFDSSIDLLREALGENSRVGMVKSQGIMGKSILLKLGPDNVVNVTHSDISRYRAAVRQEKLANSQ